MTMADGDEDRQPVHRVMGDLVEGLGGVSVTVFMSPLAPLIDS
jgi:hypothetical protein